MRGSGAPLHFIDVARPVARRISGERSPIQVKKAANEATKGISKGERDFFYIFTVITDVTYRNITLTMTSKNLPVLISRLLHFYHIYLCGTPRRPDTLAYSLKCRDCPRSSPLFSLLHRWVPQLLSLWAPSSSERSCRTHLSGREKRGEEQGQS